MKHFNRTELAELLGIKPGTLANWSTYGKGPRHTRVGHQAIYSLADIETWIDSLHELDTFRVRWDARDGL